MLQSSSEALTLSSAARPRRPAHARPVRTRSPHLLPDVPAAARHLQQHHPGAATAELPKKTATSEIRIPRCPVRGMGPILGIRMRSQVPSDSVPSPVPSVFSTAGDVQLNPPPRPKSLRRYQPQLPTVRRGRYGDGVSIGEAAVAQPAVLVVTSPQ